MRFTFGRRSASVMSESVLSATARDTVLEAELVSGSDTV